MHAPETYISPAAALIHNGIAVFSDIAELQSLQPPLRLSMTLLATCAEGEISAHVDMEPRCMQAGSILVLLPGRVLNDIRQSPDFKGYFILIDNNRLSSVAPLSTSYISSFRSRMERAPVLELTASQLESLRALHSLIRNKARTMSRPHNKMVFDALCRALFYETLGIYTELANTSTRLPGRSEELLAKFLSLVDAHYMHHRMVDFYAREMCLSAKHLTAVVKRVSGMSAGQWIDRKVIYEAKMMLRHSPRTVQQVSVALNFPSQSFFGKYFKRHTGMSPRAWRSQEGD